ncbi:hypothetical protein A7K91_06370 [Paenibacillus oryzae]|uniref:Uncharacterized protein n=1 Tax=Paenibacillus oryzae TaxID=1844972 RepID=A0A1A5YDB9_9BACL|nr:hypothetical protein [Paenibacillus oryzae]OBR63572.1 hypothetical protein A7K91_06370 [Paenibacillus oryzae]
MKKVSVVTASILVASSLVLSNVHPVVVSAASSTKPAATQAAMKAFKGAELKTFSITSKSSIQIKDVYFKYGSKEKQAFFTVVVHNGDNTPIDFMDYWVELTTKSGAKYPVKSYTATGSSKSVQVPAQTTREFTFYSQIDSKLNYSDLIFKVVKWDFSLPGYTRTVGQVNVTSAYQNAVPANSYYVQSMDNNTIKSYLTAGTFFNMGTTNQAQFELNLENTGLFEYTLPDYQFYLRTKAGLVIRLAKDQITETVVAPGEKVKYTLRTSLKNTINLTDAQLLVTVIDAESKLEIPKSVYTISWNNKNNITVEPNKAASININGINIKASIENIYTDYSGSQNNVVLTTKWMNSGKEPVALPAYKFEIMAKDGVRYPVQLMETATDIQLAPGLDKEIALQASLPAALSDGLVLLVKQPKDEKNTMEYVKTAMKLAKLQETKGVQSKIYKSEKGSYEIKVSQAERLPWGNQDMINTFLEVKNTGSKSQSIPDIAALLRLNGQAVEAEKSNLIKLDSSGMLEPSESTRYVLITKVPYTYKFGEISLNLTDKISDTKKQTIGLFKLNEISPLPELSATEVFNIDALGRRSSLQMLNTFVFEGKDDNLLYSEFKYTNKEARFTTLPALKAYFKTSDGQYIDATLTNIKAGLKADGTALVYATAPVPKTFSNQGDVQLIIGEALTANAYSKPEDKADGFVSGKSIILPKTQQAAADTISNLKLEPYEFTLNRLNTMLIDVENVKLEMKYTLEKKSIFDVVEKETKLYFEIANNKNAYGASVTITPKEGEGLETGIEKSVIVPIKGTQLANIVNGGYVLNVYEETDGYKRLLGSKKYGSFQIVR